MGYAIAETLAEKGAKVLLISGPTYLKTKNILIDKTDVTSASQMFTECVKRFPNCDAAIMTAAVADYSPVEVKQNKIKSKLKNKNIEIHLKPTKDIAKELGKLKRKNQKLIGFALETDNEEKNALKKIKSKNLDFIVLNSLNEKGAGFGYDTNRISIIHKNNKRKDFELKTKTEVANDIVEELITLISQ